MTVQYYQTLQHKVLPFPYLIGLFLLLLHLHRFLATLAAVQANIPILNYDEPQHANDENRLKSARRPGLSSSS